MTNLSIIALALPLNFEKSLTLLKRAKEVGPLSCTGRCFECIVLVLEVINQIIQEYVKGMQRIDSLRVFIKHAYEQYEVMITFIKIVYTFHI